MKLLFWAAVALIAYSYLGYAAWLWLRSRWRSRPVHTLPCTPSISLVLVVRNEAAVLRQKLTNLLELDYPPDRMEILVVSDGSTDATNEILSEFAEVPRMRTLVNSQPRGKVPGLNHAMQAAGGDIVVFTDARQQIEAGAVRLLMENFSDPEVGCVSGELMLGDPSSGETSGGLGLYWKIEKTIREMEARTGSVIGATGALYAVRRSLLESIPPETILDDVLIPMQVLRQGGRVVFDGRAQAWDTPDLGTKREFARKVRTLSGNYQLLQLAPWLLTRQNPARFDFVSHKLLRLAVPFALCAALLASALLPQPIYRIALAGQVLFYGLSACALLRLKHTLLARMADAAFTFVLLNTAAVVAFANFISGRKVAWGR